jgi:gas vesicle protein
MKGMNHSRKIVGKVVTGMLIGSVVGATVGWLTAPVAGQELRRRITGDIQSAREKAKTAEGNVESVARELAEEVNENRGELKQRAARHGKERLPLD